MELSQVIGDEVEFLQVYLKKLLKALASLLINGQSSLFGELFLQICENIKQICTPIVSQICTNYRAKPPTKCTPADWKPLTAATQIYC